ncbi:hypothetical protein C4544_05045 [candidate division WS5 bacterium]|uniref:Uncharacterized protein n=1 Tax=candidate division WS5 bacterium TaxID=2093353 RepID=A0A419DBF0_9BACT|nr:MAG: hypothetical protein C4544_05045 [candidate division WS5 bacterium]
MLLISKHLKFHLTSLHAQRAACCGISIIDKRHFIFLFQGIFIKKSSLLLKKQELLFQEFHLR